MSAPGQVQAQEATKAFSPSTSKLEIFSEHERPDARQKVGEILRDNHEKHHCFFNDKGFHNHSAHQILADFALGAGAEQLGAHYEYQLTHDLASGYKFADRSKYDPYQDTTLRTDSADAPRSPAVVKVDEDNWTKFLGNPRYYWSYLHFFRQQLEANGLPECLEKYVLGNQANRDGRQVLARFYGGVIHGLIHTGYGAEFNLFPTAAEGLAMTMSTGATHLHLFPTGWETKAPCSLASTKRLIPLMKEMLDDERLSPQALELTHDDSGLLDKPFEEGGGAFGLINDYADRWSLTVEVEVDLDAVIADLAWFSVLVLGAVPKLGRYYRHDFFLVHANNAHIFTPSLVPLLSKRSQSTYLRGLVRYYLYFWVTRGRPTFSTEHWRHESHPSRAVGWDRIFEMARRDKDEHLPKAIRALYYFSHHIRKIEDDEESTHALQLPGLFTDGDQASQPLDEFDAFLLTARELYHQQSGTDRVTWDFHGFYPDVPEDAIPGR